MTYPEKGAGYRHMPKFMDRAMAAERRADGGKVFASPEDSAMMREDVPLTQDRANQIYDAYERAGGGKDVSDSQFVKNSQFGAGPLSGLADGLGINRSSPTPAIQNVGSSDDMDDDAPPNIPKPMRRLTPR